MRRSQKWLTMLLIVALGIQGWPGPSPASAASEASAASAAVQTPLVDESFGEGLGKWDLFGSTAWTTQGSGEAAQLVGTTTSTSPQRAVLKTSIFPYSNQDYVIDFSAKGDRFRSMFRYSSGTSYYFLEFKNTSFVELWKYPNSSASVIVGAPVNIAAVLPGFNLTNQHAYKLEVVDGEFKLSIDGSLVTIFQDPDLTAGGVGFSVKSLTAGSAVYLNVDRLTISPPADAPAAFTIGHNPAVSVPYYADLPVLFTAEERDTTVTASVYYAYGEDTPNSKLAANRIGSGSYSAVIPGTNLADQIRYHIEAEDGNGNTARFPETGEINVAVNALEPYWNDFENTQPNTAPAGWTIGGNTKVIALEDGNKVLNLNGSGSARLNLPMYQNADNFVVKFRAKYERTSEAVQNTWRFRYRALDDMNNNAVEWATHNSKYFIMRKTTLGGNYYIANYVKSMLDEWHDYEIYVSGITHKLFIDGQEVAGGDDSDSLAPIKGYFQWNVVGGINLMIDQFAIEPISAPYVIDLQPSGNYAGIYSLSESPGLLLALDAGSGAHQFRMDYTVRRADGSKETVATGTKSYELSSHEKFNDTVAFGSGLNGIGTYDVTAEFAVDGSSVPGKTKRMRIVVINEAAPVQGLDLDNESKFGLNTHYSLNWKDDIIDGARKLGARHHRSGITWEEVDKNKKDASGNPIYDYSGVDAKLNKLFSYGFNQITGLAIDRNPYYQDGTVNTTSGLKAMGDFVYQTVSRYKDQIRQWEMPNEPELFAKPYIPAEFVQLQKITYLNMKKADPNAMLLAGDHTSSVLSVLPKELELGSFDYADAYSYHPYVYNSMPDGNLQNLMNGVKELVNAYGGWKDYYLTEGGWPTANAGYPSVSEAVQRDYIVRAFLNYMITDQVKAYEYYNYKNDGTDDRYYDIFWGITDNDGRPKLAYAAVNQLMTKLDKARYLGTWDTGDAKVAVQLFLNEDEPVIVAWKMADHKDNPAVNPPVSTVTLPFGASGLELTDINGASIPATEADGKLQLTVSGSPLYITGAPKSFVLGAAVQLLNSKKAEASAKLNKLRSADNGAEIDGHLAELNRIAALLGTAASNGGQAAVIEEAITDIYELMADIAEGVKNGALASAPVYVALEALYNMAESASITLSYALEGISGNTLDNAAEVQQANHALELKKGEYGIMPVSSSAVLRLNRYSRLAQAAHDRGSFAESYAYNLLARQFAGAAESMIDSEPAKFIGVMANVVPTQTNGEAGYANTLNLSLVNDTDATQQVTVRLKLPAGWEASQTGILSEQITIPQRGSLERAYQVQVPEDTLKGRYEVAVEIEYNGVVFDSKTVQLTVEDGLDVKVMPVKKPVDELEVLSVRLTGTSSFAKTGKVSIIGPDGAVLQPIGTDSFSGLRKGDQVQLNFRWTYGETHAFHQYAVDLKVEDTVHNKTIFHDAELPLDFNLVQRHNGIVIDGDLSDWADAFPIHLRTKAQNATGFADPVNLEATAYAKWDEQGMYFAIAVTDNIHKQSENAANLWKNDSVQITLDPLNNRESPYGADDVEWGFALADDGRLMLNIFSSTQPNPSGEMNNIPISIIRDEAVHKTYYELQIPAAYVKDLAPALGGKIGFNIAVNDADFQNGRDNYIQWTKGTADSKNTSLYDSFDFVNIVRVLPPDPGTDPGTGPGTDPGNGPGTNPGTDPGTGPGTNPGTDPGTGPGTNPSTDLGTSPGTNPGTNPGNPPAATERFADLAAGHWAFEAVEALFAKQIIQGTGPKTFEPNRAVTRAEFTAMLVRALGLTERGDNRFADVAEDSWYADSVAAASKAGIVSGKSATAFDPGGALMREELVTMLMKAYRLHAGEPGTAAGAVFADETNIAPWALPYVKEAAALGWIQGRGAGQFVPQGITTRAEAAKVIYQLIK
ncbi:S-layer homology domain-containing protein [Paenibacillus sp. NPDC058174]|uniref:S-layer homology domain-containing protein n=1 Tax=Paenibacillus sp. NPDC058174 TaxID=3346366 RepID=UPI0036DE9433